MSVLPEVPSFFEIVDLHATSPYIRPQTDDFVHKGMYPSIFEDVKTSPTPIPIFRGLPCALWLRDTTPVQFWVYGDIVPRFDQPTMRNCFHPQCISIQYKWKKSGNRFNGPKPSSDDESLVGDRIYDRYSVGSTVSKPEMKMFSLRITSYLTAANGRPVVPYHFVQVRRFDQVHSSKPSQRVVRLVSPDQPSASASGRSTTGSVSRQPTALPENTLQDASDLSRTRFDDASRTAATIHAATADDRSSVISAASLGGRSDFSRKRSEREDDYSDRMTSSIAGGGSCDYRLTSTPCAPTVVGLTSRSDPKTAIELFDSSTTALPGDALPVFAPYGLEDTHGEADSESDSEDRYRPPSDSVISFGATRDTMPPPDFCSHSPVSADAEGFTSMSQGVRPSELDALTYNLRYTQLASPTPKKPKTTTRSTFARGSSLLRPLLPVDENERSIVSDTSLGGSSFDRGMGLPDDSPLRNPSDSDFDLESNV